MEMAKIWVTGILSAAFLCFFPGCVRDTATLKIEKSLPQIKLAYYNDSFDKLRTDLWDKAGLVFSYRQLSNLQAADMDFENGQLVVKTKTGSFSKGGLVSTFKLRGDYDVQIDLHLDFMEDVSDMDQIIGFGALEKGSAGMATNHFYGITLVKIDGKQGGIFTVYRSEKKKHGETWHPIDGFNGSFRIVRIGNKVSTLYRQGDGYWHRTHVYPSVGKDTLIGFSVQNFSISRKSIQADEQVTGRFDSFKINAAQEIIESEI